MRGRIIDIKKLQRGGKMFAYDKYFMFLSMPGFLSIINTSYSHDNHSIISFWNFVSYFFFSMFFFPEMGSGVRFSVISNRNANINSYC